MGGCMGEVTRKEFSEIPVVIGATMTDEIMQNLKLPKLSLKDRIIDIKLSIEPQELVQCVVKYWKQKDPDNPKSGLEMYEQYYYLRANLEWYVAFERLSESSVIGVVPLTVYS